MFKFKCLTISMVVLGSSSLLAGGYNCSPENVSVPCENTAFDIGIQAIYVKPNYDNDFGYFGSTIVNNVLVAQDADLDWDFGFRIEGSYHFNTGNDFNINWTYFSKETQFTNVLDTGVTVNWKPTLNAINLELGQHVDYGETTNIRFHGGFQFANIETKISSPTFSFRPTIELKFNGFGPRAGADFSYDVGYDISVYCNAAAAVLVGDSKYTANVTNITNNVQQLARGSNTDIVPELEAKVGLKYNYALYQGDFIFDAGWMWANYFGAQNFGSTFLAGSQTDFGFQGPYIGLKFIGGV